MSKEPTTKEAEEKVTPVATPAEVKAAENKEAEQKVADRKEGAKVVKPTKGDSPEQKAAERAGVTDEALESEGQNRDPKNKFETENQKVTEERRKAAQKESNLSTEKRVEKADTPQEGGKKDAQETVEKNQGAAIADAIREGLSASKEDKRINIQADHSVTPRFALVKSKSTGKIMIRENETRAISEVQYESIEEKKKRVQEQEVEEL